MPCGVCQEVFLIFFKIFWEPFGAPLLTSVLSIPPQAPEVKNFLLKSCTISGDSERDFLCSLPIDFLLAVVYNENSARCVRQRAAEPKRALCILTKKRGATPLLAPAHIQKLEQIFVLVRKCNQMSAVICQMLGINAPSHSLDNCDCIRFTVIVQELKPYSFCHFAFLSAFPLNQERKGLQAGLLLRGRLTRPNATRPAPFCYRQSEMRERLRCGEYSQPWFCHRR